METINATSASLAMTHIGKIVYARGFGWSDEEKTMPTTTHIWLTATYGRSPLDVGLHLFRFDVFEWILDLTARGINDHVDLAKQGTHR